MGEVKSLPIDTEWDFSQVEFYGVNPFKTPVHMVGDITNRAGVVRLTAHVTFTFDGLCDRCLAPFTRDYNIAIDHILVTTLENEDSDYVLLENYQLALDDLVQADILLELPYKNLCQEDCRGLCPQCGKNLNDGLCGCTTQSVDPRLAVLQQLLN